MKGVAREEPFRAQLRGVDGPRPVNAHVSSMCVSCSPWPDACAAGVASGALGSMPGSGLGMKTADISLLKCRRKQLMWDDEGVHRIRRVLSKLGGTGRD